MARQDRRRSAILNAIETKAQSAFEASLSVENYFQTQQQRKQSAHFFQPAARHNPRR
jgi:hypothetical protein